MSLALAYSNVVSVGKPYALNTAFGSARALDYEHDGTLFKGRVVAVPLCGGSGLLMVVQNYGTGGAESAMKHALDQLRPLPGSTLCARLAH